MALIDAYAELRLAHITLVSASVLLFAVRGAAVLAGRSWPMVRPLRLASYVVDTALLMAGAALWWMLSLNPARDTWLAAKFVALVFYIVLGSLALKRARSTRARAWAFAGALGCYGYIVSVAVAHHPGGPMHLLNP